MPLVFRYHQPGDEDQQAGYVDLGDEVVRWGNLSLSQSAAIGEPDVSGVEIDDPYGALDIVGLRAFQVMETSAPSNSQLMWAGRIGDRTVRRMESFGSNAVSRRWSLDLIDANWYLGARLLVDHDSKRPAESGGDRLRWLLTGAAYFYGHDFGHVEYPSNSMDACDYRGQTAKDVLTDISTATGYNFWLDISEAHNAQELFFLSPDSNDYTSTIRISNELADVDGTTTFAPSEDAELRRSPSRIAFGVYVPYAKGSVYVRDQATGAMFAKVDQTAPNANIKTATKARSYATRFLNDNDEEDDRISCWILVPEAQVNDLRQGHRLEVKFSHFPGYESFRYMRVLHRTVTQDPENAASGYYRMDLELTPIAGTPGIPNWVYTVQPSGPGTVELTWTPTAGNKLIMMMTKRDGWNYGNYDIRSNDLAGTVWTLLAEGDDVGIFDDGAGAWYTTSVGGETGVYIEIPGSGDAHVFVAELSGATTITGSQSTYAATTNLRGPAVTPSGPAVIFGIIGQGDDPPPAVTYTAVSGWTVLAGDAPTSYYHPKTRVLYRAVTDPGGSYRPTITSSLSHEYNAVTVMAE